jgi:hypothetical protein
MRRNNNFGIGKIILAIVVIFLVLRAVGSGGASPLAWLAGLLGFVFKAGIVVGIVVLAITGAVIWFTVKDNKYRDKHDPPNVTPKAAREAAEARAKAAAAKKAAEASANAQPAAGSPAGAGQPGTAAGQTGGAVPAQENLRVADRSKVYEKTPAGVRQMLSDYRIDCILGAIAADALRQKERLEAQQESYRRLVVRRFGNGTLSAEKYLAVEKSSNDALQNSYLRIANRMEAFDTNEYLHFTSGAYKTDSIPDHVQEQRFEIYQQNLQYMKDCLADNEHILAGMDRLMLKLADSDSNDETGITEEINALEEQLAYYRKNHG